MYLLDIGGKEYRLKQLWSEILLSDAIELFKVIKEIPEKLREIYLCSSENKPTDKIILTAADTKKHFPLFYGKVIKLLSDIPQEIIDTTDWISRTTTYNYSDNGVSCKSVVFGLLHFPLEHQLQERTSFVHEGNKYFLPVSKKIGSETRPMANESAITFTESTDLEIFSEQLSGGRYECMANLISIICRPEGEKYDENISLQRVETFKSLAMDIVWDVFFSLVRYIISSKKNIPTFSRAVISKQRKPLLKVA